MADTVNHTTVAAYTDYNATRLYHIFVFQEPVKYKNKLKLAQKLTINM